MPPRDDGAQLRELIEETTELPHTVDIPILGVPVRFASSDERVVTVVTNVYRSWQSLDLPPALLSAARPYVKLVLTDKAFGDDVPSSGSRVRAALLSVDTLYITHPHARGLADAKTLAAALLFTSDALSDDAVFRHGFLDPLTLFVVTAADRQPFHAAAIRRSGSALLLTGASGSGKSTLAYAALRAGFDVMSDDAVYVQSDPVVRIWCMRSRFHVPAGAAEYFPEIANARLFEMTNGKTKHVVEPNVLDAHTLPYVERAGICFLARSDSVRAPERLSPDEAVREIESNLAPGFDRFSATIGETMRRVAAAGAWRLYVSGTPASMLPDIERLLVEVERGAN